MTVAADQGKSGTGLVVVLGAGFSKAIHDGMPTTDELGEQVSERLDREDQERLPPPDREGKRFRDGRFEEWLSYLAEEQPHLTEDKTLEARALLLRVVQRMRDVLSEAQGEALGAGPPRWFYPLLSVLNAQEATVITLNYDNLVECGVVGMGMAEDELLAGRPPLAYAEQQRPIFEQLAQVSAGGGFHHRLFGEHHVPVRFRLLKLHGSLSWYWVPGDQTGSTVQRWRLPGSFGKPEPTDEDERRRLLPGEPFVVPPASLKSDYLRNPVTRDIWRRAGEAVATAARVVVIGYSLPVADVAMSGMLAQALSAPAMPYDEDDELFELSDELAEGGVTGLVEVVNPRFGEVASRLRRLGIPVRKPPPEPPGSSNCIQTWVSRECAQLSAKIVERLGATGLTGRELVVVAGIGNRAVEEIVQDAENSRVIVKLGNPGESPARSVSTSDLEPQLRGYQQLALEIDGCCAPVIDFELHNPSGWAGGRGELTLVPAGKL